MVRLLIEILVGMVGFFVLFQVIIPVVTGTKIFSLFRGSPETNLAEAKLEKEEAEKDLRIAAIRAETESIKLKTHQLEISALDENIASLEKNESRFAKSE